MMLRRKFNGAEAYNRSLGYPSDMVGERRVTGEASAEAGVDGTRVRMPE